MMSSQRTPQTPPSIEPLPITFERPFWSIMIPTYNCTSYLKLTLKSVMQAQLDEDVQIEVVDDASTDGDVELIVRQIGKGRITYYRQEKNVGSLRNFETCIKRAKGNWVHLLHGDDLIKPNFYLGMKNLIDENPTIGAAFCRNWYINEEGKELFLRDEIQHEPGILKNWLFRIAQVQLIEPPSIVVKRCVYEKLGSFYAVHYGEDWEMWVRIAAHFPVAYSPEVLALYRERRNNISSQSILSGQNVKDIKKAIGIVSMHLPENRRRHTLRSARKHFSVYFARKANDYYKDLQYKKQGLKQAYLALQLDVNKTTLKAFTYLLFRYIF